jgi:broad specificity phosphatase PhoE
MQTAEIVAAKLEVEEVAIEQLLLERSFGDAEGMTHEQWKQDFPDGLPPGGESLEVLRARAVLLLDRLLEVYRGTRVLTVSHGALIRKLLKIVSAGELPLLGQRLGNTSLTILVHDQSGWRVEEYDPRSLSDRLDPKG